MCKFLWDSVTVKRCAQGVQVLVELPPACLPTWCLLEDYHEHAEQRTREDRIAWTKSHVLVRKPPLLPITAIQSRCCCLRACLAGALVSQGHSKKGRGFSPPHSTQPCQHLRPTRAAAAAHLASDIARQQQSFFRSHGHRAGRSHGHWVSIRVC